MKIEALFFTVNVKNRNGDKKLIPGPGSGLAVKSPLGKSSFHVGMPGLEFWLLLFQSNFLQMSVLGDSR